MVSLSLRPRLGLYGAVLISGVFVLLELELSVVKLGDTLEVALLVSSFRVCFWADFDSIESCLFDVVLFLAANDSPNVSRFKLTLILISVILAETNPIGLFGARYNRDARAFRDHAMNIRFTTEVQYHPVIEITSTS